RNLEIGIALATEPRLLCLDEPTAGMSLAETQATVELVRRIARGLTILIVEHDMTVVMDLAARITVLHYGEVLAEGTPAEIQANPGVQEVYLKTLPDRGSRPSGMRNTAGAATRANPRFRFWRRSRRRSAIGASRGSGPASTWDAGTAGTICPS